MQDNQYSLSQKKHEELTPDHLNILQQENKKLLSENAELKKELEKEEFLHKNLYKQWMELNGNTLVKEKELKRLKTNRGFSGNFYKYSFYALLVITIAFALFLLSKKNSTNTSALTPPGTADTAHHVSAPVQAQQGPQEKVVKTEKKENIVPAPQQSSFNNSSNIKSPTAGAKSTRYKVRTKTFFYNGPDESTKRSTFLLPADGPYGIITSLNDQNGFIYVIFVNHAHHTSKGWIRKSDLDVVDQ